MSMAEYRILKRGPLPPTKNDKVTVKIKNMPSYLYNKIRHEAEIQERPVNSVLVEWLEATYDRRYGED